MPVSPISVASNLAVDNLAVMVPSISRTSAVVLHRAFWRAELASSRSAATAS